ncbi:MAG TPA: DUF2079 domain-containing protein [Acidimicrobiales bacterium]|nr:DUF2079 domain-containing protein [Acidimicrobiales bacterium]
MTASDGALTGERGGAVVTIDDGPIDARHPSPGTGVIVAPRPVDPDDGVGLLPRWVRSVGWVLLGAQLLAMVALSTEQYRRFALTGDFANYSQAWWSIAHGHLNPYVSGLGVSFWRDNAEFVLYPLSLLYYLYPHPIDLLWVNDVVVVMTEVVTFVWIRRAVERAGGGIPDGVGPVLAVGAAVALALDPWAYETVAFDFHFEPIAALFCVLVGYNLWAGRTRRLWWLVPLALICHVLAGTYLLGIGLSGVLAGRRTRRPGVVIGTVGLAWVFVFTTVGAAGVKGQFVSSSYGYLVPGHRGRIGLVDIVAGALTHPGAVAHVAATHWAVIVSFLVVLGVIGLLSPWGIGMALVVLVPNVLDGSGSFIRYGAAFQSWPAMPFILVGSVMVLIRLLERGAVARRVAAVTAALWAGFLVMFAVVALPGLPRAWLWVSPPAAAELARIEPLIPPDAEVVVSLPVMGRFAQRSSVYGFIEDHQTVPVDRKTLVFVFSPYESFQKKLTGTGITGATRFVARRLDARLLGAGAGVHAFAWSPPPGTTSVTLP